MHTKAIRMQTGLCWVNFIIIFVKHAESSSLGAEINSLQNDKFVTPRFQNFPFGVYQFSRSSRILADGILDTKTSAHTQLQ